MPISAPRTTNCPALITQSTAIATTLDPWPPKARASHGAAAATSTTWTAASETAVSSAARSRPRGRSGTCMSRAVSCSMGRNTPNPTTSASDQKAPK